MPIPSPIAWNSDHTIRILDQTLLPGQETYRDLDTVEAVAEAIRTLRVRGAPLIGIAAAMGVVVAMRRGGGAAGQQLLEQVVDDVPSSWRDEAHRRESALGA